MPSSTTVENGIDLLQQSNNNNNNNNTNTTNDILEYDLGLLMASDVSTLDDTRIYNRTELEQYLLELSTQHCQSMITHLFNFPSQPVPNNETGRLVTLPKPLSQLPRSKPIPQPKPPTKWEQFAKLKGISKKKKDRLIYDEQTDSYKPRYGYRRAGSLADVDIVEHKESPYNVNDNEDPWSKEERERKDKRAKNKKQQQDNIQYNAAKGNRLPGTIDLTSVNKSSKHSKGNKQLDHVDMALNSVQHSTASMGKFDQHANNEPTIKHKSVKRDSEIQHNPQAEKSQNMAVLQSLFGREDRKEVKEKQSLNVDKAVRKLKQSQDVTNRKRKADNASSNKSKR